MSHSPPSYMDGVPVKISERFKPPPKIVLPQGVVNRLNQYDVAQVLRESCYECELEDTVLKRITEWKAVKGRERHERLVRLQAREQDRRRFIEAEQKRKLNQISYPNTDELSSASDDNDADGGGVGAGGGAGGAAQASDDEYEEENDESAPSGSSDERGNVKPFDHMSQLSSILIPTVIRDAVPSAADTQAYPNVPANANIIPKTTLAGATMPALVNATFGSNNNNNNNNNYNKINYSDFENDTSSPFDNMELRTINDLDILAQVLKQNTTLTSPCNDVTNHHSTDNLPSSETKEPQAEVNEQSSYPLATVDSYPQQAVQQQQCPSPPSTNPYNTAYDTNQQYSMYQQAGQYQQASQTTAPKSGASDYLPTSYASYQPYSNYGTQYDTPAMQGYSSANMADSRYGMNNYSSSTYHVPPVSQSHPPAYQQQAAATGSTYSYGYHHQHPAMSYVTAPSTSRADGTGTSASAATVYAPNYGYHTTATDTTTSTAGYVQFAQAGGYHGGYQPTPSSGAGVAMHPSSYATDAAVGLDAAAGLKSKSKSVPDIVRQLNDEVQDSVTRRTRNNSQTISDRQTTTAASSTSERRDNAESSSNTDEKRIDYTKYNQLVQADQNLVKRICSMGFPLERVVWVLQQIGHDDKKIIEHLIPLSELLDLGFEVEKISAALLRFGNNKHKALDYLIT